MNPKPDFVTDYIYPALVGVLIGMLLCGCATEAKLQRWFEFKNAQVEKGNINENR